ncbi:MAG: LysM peptidoglycan-binding domain-containing protein, partial [Chitinivibrionales bacterium]|nr:LysM peptidoglycan-binding domain-containing protein [Chitinivibrionales bacterium]
MIFKKYFVLFMLGATVSMPHARDPYAPPPQSTSYAPSGNSAAGGQYYLIKKWDTLWDLATRFLDDPYRWPAIYELNPYINDPHWIYPGNKLRIPGLHRSNLYTGVNKPDFYALTQGFLDNTKPVSTAGPWNADTTTDDTAGADSKFDGDNELRRKLLSDNFFSPEFMEGIGFLWFKKDARGKRYPGNGRIEKCEEGSVYRQFDEITFLPYSPGSYSVGDLINVYHSDRFVKFKGETANLIRVVAKGKVVDINGPLVQAQLYKVWDIVGCSDHIGPADKVEEKEFDEIIDAPSPVDARVFQRIQDTESPYLFTSFLIDRGEESGIEIGDLFAIYSVTKKEVVDNPSALACVVNSQEKSSSLAVVKLFSPRIEPGDKA